MTYQTAANILVAIKRETTTGTAATATGATQVRITDSPGLELKRAPIQSNEKRDDGNKSMGRLGAKSVDGSYNMELTAGGATDIIVEALFRSTWATSTAITFATMTSITTGTNEVVANAGDWIGDQGLRIGDVFTLSNHSTAANNNKNLIITALTSGTISVPDGSLTADAVADASGTLVRLKKLVQGTTPTRYTHTIEQYDQDIDLSELFLGNRVVGFKLSCKPNQPATAVVTFMGMDRTVLTTGTSPWFTSPTLTTNLMLVADDATIRYNGTTVATFTSLDLDFQITAAGQPVLGSFVSPDIFDNDMMVSGSISGLRSDFSNLTLFDAETEFEVGILLEELETAPKSCLSFFLPRVKLSGLSSPVGGGDGAKVETLQLMVAPKVAATGYDGTVAVVCSSEA